MTFELRHALAAQLYEDPARPASEVATFSSSPGDTEASFIAIDRTTIPGDAATVLPGRAIRVQSRWVIEQSPPF